MRIGKVKSIDYFSLSICDDYINRLCITIVIFHKGLSFEFFKRKGVEDEIIKR